MALSEKALIVKADLDQYLAGTEFELNSDTEAVERVIEGLAKREEKTGKRLCPCRLATGNEEADSKIVYPCVFHQEEIAEKGMCHCQLLVGKKA